MFSVPNRSDMNSQLNEGWIWEIEKDLIQYRGPASYLKVLFYDEEIVKCFIDWFVVVVLYWPQVWFDQRQLFHLWTWRTIRISILANIEHLNHIPSSLSECIDVYLAEVVDSTGVVQSGRKHYEQIIQ